MKIAQVRRFALSLPDVVEAPHFESASFRVHGKIIATAPPGDALLHVFVDEETRETALALEPDCLEKLFWGGSIRGLRVSLAEAKPRVVESLLMQAWRCKAPKKLIAACDASAASVPATAQQASRKRRTA
ncbi:MAG TPA: hypothetical protein VK753_11455 [Xanthomonadaceae bacterium]|jgi:hypothetical protein|nr:hypothetical protein [Xanthomonadaceae bacterium]